MTEGVPRRATGTALAELARQLFSPPCTPTLCEAWAEAGVTAHAGSAPAGLPV